MNAQFASLIVILLITVMRNVAGECVPKQSCKPPCECVREQGKLVCFQQSIYVGKLKACKTCDPNNCACPSGRQPAPGGNLFQNPNEKCECAIGRESLEICRKLENDICAFEEVECRECVDPSCKKCSSFITCQECENEAFMAAMNQCTANASGGSGNKVGIIIGSVIGALVVIAVIAFGVYWTWGDRNRVY